MAPLDICVERIFRGVFLFRRKGKGEVEDESAKKGWKYL